MYKRQIFTLQLRILKTKLTLSVRALLKSVQNIRCTNNIKALSGGFITAAVFSKEVKFMNTPLADLIRPKALDEVVGQQHLIGNGKPLRRIIESGHIPNMIFYGPSGLSLIHI